MPYRVGGPAQWYTLADCVASKLMTGKAPRVLRALCFPAGDPQANLRAIDVAGDPRYRVDPNTDDVIRRLVELRIDVRAEQKVAERAGAIGDATILDAIQQAMKATANSAAYGSPIELNPIEHRKRTPVIVHEPDGTSYRAMVSRTEQPGKWFHPLIATLVAGGGRLLLAAAMRLVADLGGHYAVCDTDSLFIVATRDGRSVACPTTSTSDIASLRWTTVDHVTERFEALNPYRTIRGSILEIEDDNLDPATGDQREIECYAIASKRYALFTRDPDGRPQLLRVGNRLKRSEHGLGHLLRRTRPPPSRMTEGGSTSGGSTCSTSSSDMTSPSPIGSTSRPSDA